jgi:hypothetical protein
LYVHDFDHGVYIFSTKKPHDLLEKLTGSLRTYSCDREVHVVVVVLCDTPSLNNPLSLSGDREGICPLSMYTCCLQTFNLGFDSQHRFRFRNASLSC